MWINAVLESISDELYKKTQSWFKLRWPSPFHLAITVTLCTLSYLKIKLVNSKSSVCNRIELSDFCILKVT